MKAYRSKPVKTQQSQQRSIQEPKNKKASFHSVMKNKRKSPTPRRFAEVISKKQKLQSTNDKKDSSKSNQTKHAQSSIVNAISVLKGNTISLSGQGPSSITPFSIYEQRREFEEQLSFKGANNRILLLGKVNEIERQANAIFQRIKNINKNTCINFITFKLLKNKEKDIRLSYYDFYSHLGTLTTKINSFVVELERCRNILNQLTTGITHKTMQFYIDRFEALVAELTTSTKYLEDYLLGLKKDQQQENRRVRAMTGRRAYE